MDDDNFPTLSPFPQIDFRPGTFISSHRDRDFDDRFNNSFAPSGTLFFIIFGIVLIVIVCAFSFVIFAICFRICKGQSYQNYRRQCRGRTIIPPPPQLINPSPVVVTTTTIPVPPSAGYPAQSTIIQGYPMPQPQPGYPPQPSGMYPNHPMPQPYPMPQTQADLNPPSYDQVVRGGDAYQKQAPYNPNYTGQQ